jgi:hypothetical protein
VRVPEQVAPALQEADQLDVAARDRLGAGRIGVETLDVGAERLHALLELALRRRQPELRHVVPERGVGADQVRVVLGRRDLREVVLHHARALAHGGDDPELSVRVVVGEDPRSPQDEVVRSPSRRAAQLVLDERHERGREHLAAHDRLARRERLRDRERQDVVPALGHVQHDRRAQDEHQDDEQEGDDGSHRRSRSRRARERERVVDGSGAPP